MILRFFHFSFDFLVWSQKKKNTECNSDAVLAFHYFNALIYPKFTMRFIQRHRSVLLSSSCSTVNRMKECFPFIVLNSLCKPMNPALVHRLFFFVQCSLYPEEISCIESYYLPNWCMEAFFQKNIILGGRSGNPWQIRRNRNVGQINTNITISIIVCTQNSKCRI